MQSGGKNERTKNPRAGGGRKTELGAQNEVMALQGGKGNVYNSRSTYPGGKGRQKTEAAVILIPEQSLDTVLVPLGKMGRAKNYPMKRKSLTQEKESR